MKCQWDNRAYLIGALNAVSRLNRAAERMFTSKRAVNSGQICNRFILSFSLPSPSPTDTVSPSLGSHRCWQWWLWNEFSLNEGFSLNLNPSAWQKTTMLSAFFGLYLFTSSPWSLSPLFSSLFLNLASLVLFFSASHSLVSFSRTHDDKNALSCDAAWTFSSEYKTLMWSPRSVFDGVLPHVALCAMLVCALTDIHLILCLEHNVHMKCIKEAVWHVMCHPVSHNRNFKRQWWCIFVPLTGQQHKSHRK